jgi:membrane protein required for colicin V production
MNWLDWALVTLLILSSIVGLTRGFFKEIFALIIWVIAIVCANVFSHQLEPLLTPFIASPSLRALAAFSGVGITVLILGALINYLISLFTDSSGMSAINHFLGMLFGFIRGVLIIFVLLIYLPNYIPVKQYAWFQQAQTISYFVPYQALVKNAASDLTHGAAQVVAKFSATKK